MPKIFKFSQRLVLLYARMTRMLELHTLWIIMIYASLTRYAGITRSYKYTTYFIYITPAQNKFVFVLMNHIMLFLMFYKYGNGFMIWCIQARRERERAPCHTLSAGPLRQGLCQPSISGMDTRAWRAKIWAGGFPQKV